jgi:sugar O-acyltransferase (sialic acid O-acetyltransferase NeuD family)
MMKNKPGIILFGAGGHAKVVAELAEESGFSLAGFVDSQASRIGEIISPFTIPILASQATLEEALGRGEPLPKGAIAAALAFGHNVGRMGLYKRLEGLVTMPTLIHPRATVSRYAHLGDGTVVMAGVVINAAVKVGRAVILNTGCVVEHDCELEDGVHVSPNATLCGNVTVKQGAWIGAGATVIPGVKIGAMSVVGAGATVIDDVPEGVIVAGVPARIIKSRFA